MRNNLLEIQNIDRYLFGEMDTAEETDFHNQLLVSPELQEKLQHHRQAHFLIRWLGRHTKRRQLEALYEKLQQEEPFRQQLNALF